MDYLMQPIQYDLCLLIFGAFTLGFRAGRGNINLYDNLLGVALGVGLIIIVSNILQTTDISRPLVPETWLTPARIVTLLLSIGVVVRICQSRQTA
jgi:hypothetical protein